MKKLLLVTILVTTTVLKWGCGSYGTDHEPDTERNYRQDMRDFVQGISAYAKGIKSNFIVIPQNGKQTHLPGWPRKILNGLVITKFVTGIRIGRTLSTGKTIPI